MLDTTTLRSVPCANSDEPTREVSLILSRRRYSVYSVDIQYISSYCNPSNNRDLLCFCQIPKMHARVPANSMLSTLGFRALLIRQSVSRGTSRRVVWDCKGSRKLVHVPFIGAITFRARARYPTCDRSVSVYDTTSSLPIDDLVLGQFHLL